jgi:hypothetical protein
MGSREGFVGEVNKYRAPSEVVTVAAFDPSAYAGGVSEELCDSHIAFLETKSVSVIERGGEPGQSAADDRCPVLMVAILGGNPGVQGQVPGDRIKAVGLGRRQQALWMRDAESSKGRLDRLNRVPRILSFDQGS